MSMKEVAQYGIKFNTLITNNSCVFGMSSGVAGLNPKSGIRARVQKSKLILLNYDGMPAGSRHFFEEGRGKEHGKSRLQELVSARLQEAIDSERIYQPGEEIVGFHVEGLIQKSIFSNTGPNQPAKVVSFKQIGGRTTEKGFGVFKSETLKIQVKLELDTTDQWWKLRNDGIKCTTTPVDLKFYSLKGVELDYNWDLFLGIECLKGRLGTLIAYTFAQGGGAADVAAGKLHLDQSGVIDLTSPKNEVYTWLNQNVETIWIEFWMARSEYDVLIQARGQCDDLNVVREIDGAILLREKTHVLLGQMVAEVEISTPRENSKPSAMTLEMLASLTLQNRKLAESINHHSKEYRSAVKGVVDMITTKPGTVPEFNLTSSDRKRLEELVGEIQSREGKQILRKYKECFPQGVLLSGVSSNSGRKTSLFLNFDSVSSMATFIGGVGEGIAGDIVAFLSYINKPGEGNVDNAVYSKLCALKASMEGWLFTSLESKSILKRMARTYKGAAIGMKVRTAPWTMLHHNPGELPKVAINPKDDVLKSLAQSPNGKGFLPQYCELVDLEHMSPAVQVNDDRLNREARQNGQKWIFVPQLMNGTTVIIGRTPMPMGGACELVLSRQVGIAHCVVLPHIWAMLTEGDSDGDGILLYSGSAHGLTVEEGLLMNEHPMGLLGYKIAYGKNPANWPSAEFVSYGDKWGKKALIWESDSETEKKYLTAYVLDQPRAVYERNAELVAAHYRGPVGISYNICVVLTHKTVNLMYEIESVRGVKTPGEIQAMEQRLVLLQMSMAVAWRLLYEGLGLAGYTPQAKEFFSLLQIGTFQSEYTYKKVEDGWGGIEPSWIDQKTKDAEKRNCLKDLIYLGNHRDGEDFSEPSGGISHLGKAANAIMSEIVKANRIAQDGGALIKGSDRVKNMTAGSRKDAILYMSLRQIGRGSDPAGQNVLEAEEQEFIDDEAVQTVSLLNTCLQEEGYKLHSAAWVQEVLKEACQVHQQANRLLYDRKQVEFED